MKIRVIAEAPTVYQLNSLIAFGMGFKERGNGSFFASEEFDTIEEAKEFLIGRAYKYNDEDSCGSEERLNDMLADIEHGALTLDAVTAYIEEIEEEDEQQ